MTGQKRTRKNSTRQGTTGKERTGQDKRGQHRERMPPITPNQAKKGNTDHNKTDKVKQIEPNITAF